MVAVPPEPRLLRGGPSRCHRQRLTSPPPPSFLTHRFNSQDNPMSTIHSSHRPARRLPWAANRPNGQPTVVAILSQPYSPASPLALHLRYNDADGRTRSRPARAVTLLRTPRSRSMAQDGACAAPGASLSHGLHRKRCSPISARSTATAPSATMPPWPAAWRASTARPVMVIGNLKGRTLKERVARKFGSPDPEGYRKALRAMKIAEKFGHPVFTFLDLAGANPGIGAEERGQGEAIARNLLEMSRLRVPTIATITGEGGSGGALALAVADRVLMLENAIYSVISPEGCASIMWKDASKKQQAAAALKYTAYSVKELGCVDDVLSEPDGGTHTDPACAMSMIDERLQFHLAQLDGDPDRPAAGAAIPEVPQHRPVLRNRRLASSRSPLRLGPSGRRLRAGERTNLQGTAPSTTAVPPPPAPLPRGPGRASAASADRRLLAALAWYFCAKALAASAANGLGARFDLGEFQALLEALFQVFLVVLGDCDAGGHRATHGTAALDLGLPRASDRATEWAEGAALGWGMAVAAVLPIAARWALKYDSGPLRGPGS